jgi:hypothetical protein
MTTIEKVSESTRQITAYGTVLETTTTLWADGIYTVYVEYDWDHIYGPPSRCCHDPLIDNATEPPDDDDIVGAWETAIGW